jgi:hypothetical protein
MDRFLDSGGGIVPGGGDGPFDLVVGDEREGPGLVENPGPIAVDARPAGAPPSSRAAGVRVPS